MENLKIEVVENKTYWQRMRKALIFPLVFVLFILMVRPVLDIYSHKPIEIPFGIIIYCIIVLIFVAFLCDSVCSTFITLIEINENNVHIVFTKRNKKHAITNTIEKFSFRLKNTLSPARCCIEITYENRYSLTQYYQWNWKKEEVFFELWDYLKKRNILKTGWFS